MFLGVFEFVKIDLNEFISSKEIITLISKSYLKIT